MAVFRKDIQENERTRERERENNPKKNRLIKREDPEDCHSNWRELHPFYGERNERMWQRFHLQL